MSDDLDANAIVLDVPDQISAVRSYQAARDEVERLETLVKKAKERRDTAEQRVLDLYSENGIQSVRLDGRLVYLERRVWARPIPGHEDELVTALMAEGHDDLVERKVGTQRLSAWWRECEREEVVIPETVREYVSVAETFGLRMKRG